MKDAFGGDGTATVFTLERKGKSYAVCWHNKGDGVMLVPDIKGELSYVTKLGGEGIPVERKDGILRLAIAEKRYLITDMPICELRKALAKATLEN